MGFAKDCIELSAGGRKVAASRESCATIQPKCKQALSQQRGAWFYKTMLPALGGKLIYNALVLEKLASLAALTGSRRGRVE